MTPTARPASDNAAASSTVIQRCPTRRRSSAERSAVMMAYVTQPPDSVFGLDPAPRGLRCALTGGGASSRLAPWSANATGLASSAAQAYVLNSEVRIGQFPPMPAHWNQMTAAQRNAYECQAAQLFADLNCTGGQASLGRDMTSPDATSLQRALEEAQTAQNHAHQGPSLTDALGDIAVVLGTGAQQALVPEADPEADGPEAEADATAIRDLTGDSTEASAGSEAAVALNPSEQTVAREGAASATKVESATLEGEAARFSGAARTRAEELQASLPEGSRGRVTMAVGVGRDEAGNVRTIIGTSEPGGYLRPGVTLNPGEELAAGTGHAEQDVIESGSPFANPFYIAAGRPICAICAAAIEESGATPASPLR